MGRKLEIEVKVGIFVSIGLALTMLAILVLGSTTSLTAKKNHYFAKFAEVSGLIEGAKVVVAGVPVGTVEALALDSESRAIKVQFSVTKEASDWVRKDSYAEIATQGVLGDKYITVSPGSPKEELLQSGTEIQVKVGKDLSQFLSKSDQLMANLTSISAGMDRMLKTFESGNRSEIFFQGMSTSAKNLSQATEKLNRQLDKAEIKDAVNNLNSILQKINDGTGTLGALVNDPGLYDDAKALLGGANRSKIVRNLVRQTIKKSEEADSTAAQDKNKK